MSDFARDVVLQARWIRSLRRKPRSSLFRRRTADNRHDQPQPMRTLKGKEVDHPMTLITAFMSLFNSDREEGQGLAEYALILALIAIVAIVALIFLGGQVSGILSKVGASV